MSIATVVSNALNQSGMTQKELVSSIGVTQSYVSQICSGKNSYVRDTAQRMRKFIEIVKNAL